ncbi:MAG: MBL fold metallo-hydrolase, partial [Puniceicoccales bacterium]
MRIRIEDEVEDVVAKAQSGLGMADGELAELSGVPRENIRRLRKGEFDAATARGIAKQLKLAPEALVALGEHRWYPDDIELDGLAMFNTPHPVPGYEEMTVNAYLVWDPLSGEVAAFDTGANADGMIEALQSKPWKLTHIFLTHTHRDHVADLDKLKKVLQPGGSIHVHSKENITAAKTLVDGQTFQVGALEIVARETSGHSPGGTTYVIHGLQRPVAIVG